MSKKRRTIESILDLEKGITIESDDFFSQPEEVVFRFRTQIEIDIQNNVKRFVCLFCKQNIKIRGGGFHKTILHFAHLKDSNECPIKTDNKFSKEQIERIKYNGAKESQLHIMLKNKIAFFLLKNPFSTDVKVEKIQKDKAIPHTWKRPDVSAVFKTYRIVFELQLSTTFLSVIVNRQEFYKRNRIYILWVFSHFENKTEKRKFTQSDIFFNNNRNGFEFNKEAQMLSNKKNNLVLCCHYSKPVIDNNNISYIWEKEFITLQDLTFNEEKYQVYYYDVDGEEKRLKQMIILNNSEFLNIILRGNLRQLFEKFTHSKLSTLEYNKIKELYFKRVQQKKTIESNTTEYLIIMSLISQKLKETSPFNHVKLEGITLFEEFRDSFAIQKLVLALLSLKTNKIIGYAFKKQVQISHNLLDKYPKFLFYYLKAISKYKTLKIQEGGKLEKKINKIQKEFTKQEKQIKIIEVLFPELK